MTQGDPSAVLIVDPDKDERRRIRELVQATAREGGIAVRVHEASDGTTGLASLDENRPALVLTEILLPGLSGLALLRHAQQEQRTDTAFVFVTSLDREVDRYWGLRNGAHAYITKPYKDEALREWIQRLLDEGPQAAPQRPGQLR